MASRLTSFLTQIKDPHFMQDYSYVTEALELVRGIIHKPQYPHVDAETDRPPT